MITSIPDKSAAAIIKLCVAGIVLVLLYLWGYGNGKERWEGKFDAEKAAHTQTKRDHAGVLKNLADLTQAARVEAKARATTYATETAANDKRHQTEKAHAIAAKDRVIADLRSGRVQLHDWWSPNQSYPADAGAAADPAGEAAASELRAEGAGDLVQVGAEADADRSWYIAELIATRAVCGTR